jgi:tRNA/tmRNA/rRNA uracil-C5-methylase (TrmA/RlmC/RlmD family)
LAFPIRSVEIFEMRLVDLKIEDVAFGGKGVGRDQGKAIFVPYTIEGELVSAEIMREKKQFAEAGLAEVRESSPHRVTPECPYFGRCGGCAYQHIAYEHQLAIKWRQVRDVLQRINHPVAETVRISQPHHGSCAGWRDWIFPARFTSLDRRRTVPDFVRRRESRVEGPAERKSA